MSLLVCAATARELAALAPHLFPEPEKLEEMRPMQTRLKNRDGIFLVTGVGPVNAALAIGIALGLTFDQNRDCPGIEAILYTGLAGSFDLERTPLCSLWQVEEEIWPEYGLNDGISVTARAFRFPLWQNRDIFDTLSLADISAITPSANFHGNPWPKCRSLTVAGVSASFVRRDKLWNQYHAELENMEGFAAAYAAARAEIPCVEIRSISNKTGPRSRAEKDFDGALKALRLVLPALNLI